MGAQGPTPRERLGRLWRERQAGKVTDDASAERVVVLIVVGSEAGAERLRRDGLTNAPERVRPLIASVSPLTPAPPCCDDRDIRVMKAAAASHGPAFRRRLRSAAATDRVGVYLRNDAWCRTWMPHVRIIVGLDPGSARAARQMARRRQGLLVADSLERAWAMASDLDPHAADSPPSLAAADRTGRRHLAGASGSGLARDEVRAARVAVAQAVEALRHDHDAAATAIVAAALRATADDRLRPTSSETWPHGRSELAARRLQFDAYQAELRQADHHLDQGDPHEAAACYAEALRTGFSPVIHMQQTPPLACDPAGYTTPLAASRVAAAVREGPPRTARVPIAARPIDRSSRVLVAAQYDDKFVRPIVDHLRRLPCVEVRYETFARTPAVVRFGKQPHRYVEELLRGGNDSTTRWRHRFASTWTGRTSSSWSGRRSSASLLSRMDRGGTRLVARLHAWRPSVAGHTY